MLWLGTLILSFISTGDRGYEARADWRRFEQSILRSVVESHPWPPARAWAMAAWSKACGQLPNRDDAERLFDAELDPHVRAIHIHLSGLYGADSRGLNLGRLLFEELPDAVMTQVVQAYTYQGYSPPQSIRVEFYPGYTMRLSGLWGGRLPRRDQRVEERLRALLATRADSALRDACSIALAYYARGADASEIEIAELVIFDEAPPDTDRAPSLPSFVHSCEVWPPVERAAMRVSGATVLIRAPSEAQVDVHVGFRLGGPTSVYPQICHYRSSLASYLWKDDPPRRWSYDRECWLQEAAAGPLSVRSLPVPPATYSMLRGESAHGLRPPGSLSMEQAIADEEVDVSDARTYRWALEFGEVPSLRIPRKEIGELGDPTQRVGTGIEWRGLRVNSPQRLENPVQDAGSHAEWACFRNVDTSSLSIGEERERFLHYAGHVGAAGPYRVGWLSDDKTTIVLRPRPVAEYVRLGLSPGSQKPRTWAPSAFVIHSDGMGNVRARRIEASALQDEIVLVDPYSRPREFEGFEVVESRIGLNLGEAELRSQLQASLSGSGFTLPEIKEFFTNRLLDRIRKPGVRVLTLSPRWLCDFLLPLEVVPTPARILRAGFVFREGESFESRPGWLNEPHLQAPRPWPIETRMVDFLRTTREPQVVDRDDHMPRTIEPTHWFRIDDDDQGPRFWLLKVDRHGRWYRAFRASSTSVSAELWLDKIGKERPWLVTAESRVAHVEGSMIEVVDANDGSALRFQSEGVAGPISLSGDGKRLAWLSGSVGGPCSVHVVDLETGRSWCVLREERRYGRISDAVLDFTGRFLIVPAGQYGNEPLLFDLDASTVSCIQAAPSGENARFGQGGKLFLSPSRAGGRPPMSLILPSGPLTQGKPVVRQLENGLSLNPRFSVSRDTDARETRLTDSETGQTLRRSFDEPTILELAISADGEFVLTTYLLEEQQRMTRLERLSNVFR